MPATTERSSTAALGRVRLRHLQCFLAIVRTGTLGGAAQALSITQPAVTKTVNELEEILGARLFVRGRKGVALTPEAEVFVPHANASMEALARAVDSVLAGPGETPLNVGVLPTLATGFLPAVLRRFAQARPSARLKVQSGRNKALIELLRRRELDVFIGRLSDPEAMLGVTFEHLYAEPMIIAMRKAHPFALRHASRPAHRPAPMSELSAYGLLIPPEGTLIRQVADAFLARHGVMPQAGVVETMETSLARSLVLGGDHVWLTPLGCAQPDIAAGSMVRMSIDITPEEPVGVMMRTDTMPTPTLQALLAATRDEAARLRIAPSTTRKRRPKT
jgi:LysR family pca operon transcriptional activator